MSIEMDDFASELYEGGLRVEDQDLRLLKAIVSDDQAARTLSSVRDGNLFMGDAKPFADAALGYFKSYNTVPTRRVMLDTAKSQGGVFDQFSEIWDRLENIDYNKSEFSYDLDKVKDRYTRNEIVNLREKLDETDLSDERLEEVLRSIRTKVEQTEKLRRGDTVTYTQKTLKEYMPEFREAFVQKAKDPELGRGILTGYSYLDYVTNGMSPSDMMIIGAETGGGKSMMLANMAAQMWMQNNTIDTDPSEFTKGYNVLYFSLEMPFDQCARRTMARLSGISTYALRDCQIADEEKLENLKKAAKFIRSYEPEFEIVDIPRGVTAQQIEERFLESIAKGHRPDVVVVDYLGLMDAPDEDGDDWLRLGKIAGKLHEFARVYGVVVLTAVQLNRPKTKDRSDIIGLQRVGRSSNIMHHATIGIQIETRPDEDTYSDMPYHIIKNRNGERGSHNLQKKFECATLMDMPYKRRTQDDVGEFTAANAMEDLSDRLEELWPVL